MTKNPKKLSEFGPLHSAAITGDKESLKTIFRNNLCDINDKDKVGYINYLRGYPQMTSLIFVTILPHLSDFCVTSCHLVFFRGIFSHYFQVLKLC